MCARLLDHTSFNLRAHRTVIYAHEPGITAGATCQSGSIAMGLVPNISTSQADTQPTTWTPAMLALSIHKHTYSILYPRTLECLTCLKSHNSLEW